METNDILQAVLRPFMHYYNLRENPTPPFAAEAEFHSHSEQYFLTRAAHIADIDSHEYVFFAEEEHLTQERLEGLEKSAWEEGLSRVKPGPGHRNSDVALIIIADKIEETALPDTQERADCPRGASEALLAVREGALDWSWTAGH